jgi:glutathione S-transferase
MSVPEEKITLYYAHRACSIVPRALLTYFKITFTGVRMVLTPAGPQSLDATITAEEYRRINPAGYVPTLTVTYKGTYILTEVPAILTWIATHGLHPGMLGENSGSHRQARVVEWMTWLSGTVHGRAFAMMRRPGRFSDDESAWEGIRKKGRELLEECYAEIERRLVKGYAEDVSWLTVVDFYLYIFWFWGKEVGLEMEKDYPTFMYKMSRLEEEFPEVEDLATEEGWEQ